MICTSKYQKTAKLQLRRMMVKSSKIGPFSGIVHLQASRSQQTITQKMADQGRSDLDVVFTMILCATNFSIWKAITAHIHKLASNIF